MGCQASKERNKSQQVASAIADAIVRAGDPDAIDLSRIYNLCVPHTSPGAWCAPRADAAASLLAERLRTERARNRSSEVMLCMQLIAYIYGLREGCAVELDKNDYVTIAPVVHVGRSDTDRSSCTLNRAPTHLEMHTHKTYLSRSDWVLGS